VCFLSSARKDAVANLMSVLSGTCELWPEQE
jgi:hypothetical protein